MRSREREIYIVTGIGSLVNIGLFLFKLIAGILGKSSAMIADAIHSLTDFITDVIVVIFVRLSAKPADKTHSYGHGKFETLATFFISLSLLVVGIGIFVHAAKEVIMVIGGTELESPKVIALWAALLSILCKEILFHYTRKKGESLDSSAVIANAWHHRSDALSSVCTAIGIGGAILLGGKWVILDPLAACLVSVFVLKVSLGLMRPCLDDLLERSLPDDIKDDIIATAMSVPGIEMPSRLMTRRVGMRYAIEFDLEMEQNVSVGEASELANAVTDKLKDKYGKQTHVGIHIKAKKK